MDSNEGSSILSNIKDTFYAQVDGLLSPLQKTGEKLKRELEHKESELRVWEENLREREADVAEKEARLKAALRRVESGVSGLVQEARGAVFGGEGTSELRDPKPLLVAQEVEETPFEKLPSITSDDLTMREAQVLAFLQKWMLDRDVEEFRGTNREFWRFADMGIPMGTVTGTMSYLKTKGYISKSVEDDNRIIRLNCVLEDSTDVLAEYWGKEA